MLQKAVTEHDLSKQKLSFLYYIIDPTNYLYVWVTISLLKPMTDPWLYSNHTNFGQFVGEIFPIKEVKINF